MIKAKQSPQEIRSAISRINFFQKIVKIQAWKDSITGENETRVINVLNDLGYILNKDYVRQHPIGERFVIDIAFLKEQIAIEVDSKKHEYQKQWLNDKKRDSYLQLNNWIALRIKDKEFFGYKGSFYKSLIKEIVEDRRKQWEVGCLFPIDIPNYVDEDYE